MAKQFAAQADRVNVHQEITAKIVAALEAGVRPWAKSWKTGGKGMPGMPIRHNGEYYSGINVVLCWSAMEQNGWSNPCFMTFDQAKKLGGSVRKGEKATRVVFYSTFNVEKESDSGETEEKTIPFLKTYCVFNCEQIDGLPAEFYDRAVAPQDTPANIATADEFFARLGINIRHGGDRAFYSPSGDFVGMPSFDRFNTPVDYYATLAHEFTHATGHPSRCNREFGKRFGDRAYAFEELIAELGAAFLCAELGLTMEPREDHASYLKSWIDVLKTDSKAIFTAASQASKAVAWMREREAARLPVAA